MTGLLTQTKTQQFPNEYMGSIALQSYQIQFNVDFVNYNQAGNGQCCLLKVDTWVGSVLEYLPRLSFW